MSTQAVARSGGGGVAVDLPVAGSALTIYEAAALAAAWVPELVAASAWQLRLDGVEEVDSAGLQLLLWLRQEAARRGSSLRLVAPSAAVLDVLRLCNADEGFELAGGIAA